jgi:hypothetical protein
VTRQRRAIHVLTARLGLVAILFQAILFGWHHHDLSFAKPLPAAVVENPAAAPLVADDEDGCEICQVLHHQHAASAVFVAAPAPSATAAGLAASDTALVARTLALAFRARAPPLA